MSKASKGIHPDLTVGLDQCARMIGLPFDFENSLQKIRGRINKMTRMGLKFSNKIQGVSKEHHSIKCSDGSAKLSLFVYRPCEQSEPLPVLYWMHSGGLIIGTAEQDEIKLKQLVHDIGCVVIAVDYRLAPEHPFPAPLEDCYSGLQWAHNNAHTLKIVPSKIAVGGESAGAGLAASLAQLSRDRQEVSISFQMLLYPMLDDRTGLKEDGEIRKASETRKEDDFIAWSRGNNHFGWSSYLQQQPVTESTPKYASAIRTENLEGLPPANILVGDMDLFAPECAAYADRLISAGVTTNLHQYPGGFHGFENLVPDADISKRLIHDRNEALKAAFQ